MMSERVISPGSGQNGGIHITAFESLKEKTEATGLYKVLPGSLIYAELMAYAEGLNIFYDALEELERECFAATAQDYGLTMYEDVIPFRGIDRSIEGRRKTLSSLLSLNISDFRHSSLSKISDIFNIHANYTSDVDEGTFTCDCSDELTGDQRAAVRYQMAKLVPCYFDFEFINRS